MNTNEFSVDDVLNAPTPVPNEPNTSFVSNGGPYLPNAAMLRDYISRPDDGSLLQSFIRSKMNKDKLKDVMMTEVLNYLVAETVDVKYYLLARLFCNTTHAAEISKTGRRKYHSDEWFSAASSGLGGNITDTKSLMMKLKSLLIARPEFVSVASNLISRFRK